jgi:hypothetical protein
LRDGQWHHVAAVAINSDYGAVILLYVDGELENVVRGNVSQPLETATEHKQSEPISFARNLNQQGRLLRGALDEVYVFETALSGDEIRQLMHAHEVQ